MKKIGMALITSSLLFSSISIAKELNTVKIEKPKVYNKKRKASKKFDQEKYIYSIKERLNNAWGIPENAKGYANVKLIMDTNAGKIMTFFVTKIEGDKNFKEHLKKYIRKVKKIQFSKHQSPEPFIEIKISFKTDTKIKIPESEKYRIYKDKKDMYKNYLKYLIKEKGIKRSRIKQHLNAKKDTFIKSMLYALYYDYEKHDPKKAEKYYNIIIKRYPDKVKEKKEGLIISEWLLRKGNYPLILKIFPERSCQFFKKPEKQECYYMRGIAKYKEGLDYDLELNIAKNYFPQAEEIMKKGGTKK